MSKENLHRIIDELPADKAERLEQWAISLLQEDEPTPGPRLSFEEAMERTMKTFDKTLRRLAE